MPTMPADDDPKPVRVPLARSCALDSPCRPMEVQSVKTCDLCDGKGYVAIVWIEHDPRRFCRCERCQGTGKLREAP